MRHIVISGLPAGTVFFTASNKRHDFREKVTEYEMCGLLDAVFFTASNKRHD